MNLHHDPLFAPLDADLHLARIGGGNETEVYATDDQRYVVKVKHAEAAPAAEALIQAQILRDAANTFTQVISSDHSVPSYFVLAQNAEGLVQPVVIQPYYRDALPLNGVNYKRLRRRERVRLARQLLVVIGRSLLCLFTQGWMPDLYGRSSRSKAERSANNGWHHLPQRVWSFLVERNLLRSNNLMLTNAPKRRLILVDYDPIKAGRLYRLLYYSVRLLLFGRDIALLLTMLVSGRVPAA
jgi:hypothetical protein